ncbi:MAG: hypothetical protein SOU88_06420 [Candidatus Treponema excrementipullorum]|nr:hypothetical protein [Candidatus Treponema excrementipullorum]
MSFDTVVMIWILSVILLLKAAGLCKTSSLSFSEKQKLINTIMLIARVEMLIAFIFCVVSLCQSFSKIDKLQEQIIKYEQAQKQYELIQGEELALQELKQEILQEGDRFCYFISLAILAVLIFIGFGVCRRMLDGIKLEELLEEKLRGKDEFYSWK